MKHQRDLLDRALRQMQPVIRQALLYDLPETRKATKGLLTLLEQHRSLCPDAQEREQLDAQIKTVRLILERTKQTPAGQRSGPTPETAEQVRQRPATPITTIEYLRQRGALSDTASDAAEEIQEVMQAVSSKLMARVPDPSEAGGGPRSGAPVQPVTTLPPRLARAYYERYLPWTHEMQSLPASKSVDHGNRLEYVISILVDGESLRSASTRWGMSREKAQARFIHALERYAAIKRSDREAIQEKARAEMLGTAT